MKTIHIVQCYDRNLPERGWAPVYSCDSRGEAVEWAGDKLVEDRSKGITGKSYRIEPCPFINR